VTKAKRVLTHRTTENVLPCHLDYSEKDWKTPVEKYCQKGYTSSFCLAASLVHGRGMWEATGSVPVPATHGSDGQMRELAIYYDTFSWL